MAEGDLGKFTCTMIYNGMWPPAMTWMVGETELSPNHTVIIDDSTDAKTAWYEVARILGMEEHHWEVHALFHIDSPSEDDIPDWPGDFNTNQPIPYYSFLHDFERITVLCKCRSFMS